MKPVLEKLLSAAAVVVLCLLMPVEAEARFGKAGSGNKSSSDNNSSSSERTHSASPVGSSDSSGGSSGSGSSGGYTSGSSVVYQGYTPYYSCWSDPYCTPYAWGFGYRPFWGYAQPVYIAPAPTVEAQVQRPLVATLGAEAQGYTGGGGGLGLSLAFEGERFGLATRFNGIFVPADDGTTDIDSIKLFDIHATYALLTGDHGRLRVGFGLDTAFAPSVIFAGPGLSASGALGLAGPLGLEGSIGVTPFPYIKVDMSAGLALGFGPIGIRGGWRQIFLADNGYVDGVNHADLFSGPYVAFGLAL